MKRLFLIAFLAAPLLAQESVIVTATRLPDVPPPGSFVLTSDDWVGLSSLLEALERLPGLRLVQTGSASTAFLTGKGFGESGHTRLRVLVDGLPVNAPDLALPALGSLPLASVARIEWVPSAGTARWGDGAVAGVLNIVTLSETDKPVYEARLAADNRLGSSLEGRIAVPAGDHHFFLSAWRLQLLPERERSESLGWGASARWVWTPPYFQSSLGFHIDPAEDSLPGSLTPAQFAENPDQALPAADRTGRFSWRATASLESPSRRDPEFQWSLPLAFSRRVTESDYSAFSSFNTTLLSDVSWFPVLRWYIEETGQAAQKFDLGADLSWSRLELTRYTAPDRSTVSGTADTQRWLYGGFLGAYYSYDAWGIGIDLRLQQARYNGGATATGEDELTAFGFSGRTGFQDGFQSYFLQGSQVFRLPLLDEKISYYGWGDAFLDDLGPEQGYSWDFSAAWDWGAVRVDLQLYLLFMREEIAYDPALMRNVNQGNSRRLGARPSFQWENDGFSFRAAYGWTDARTGWDLNASRNFLPLVPAHEAEVSLVIPLPMGFSAKTDAVWTGAVFYDQQESKSLEARLVWNASLAWEGPFSGGAWKASFRADNILDDRTPTSAFVGFSDDGFYPSPGRSFRLALEVRY